MVVYTFLDIYIYIYMYVCMLGSTYLRINFQVQILCKLANQEQKHFQFKCQTKLLMTVQVKIQEQSNYRKKNSKSTRLDRSKKKLLDRSKIVFFRILFQPEAHKNVQGLCPTLPSTKGKPKYVSKVFGSLISYSCEICQVSIAF